MYLSNARAAVSPHILQGIQYVKHQTGMWGIIFLVQDVSLVSYSGAVASDGSYSPGTGEMSIQPMRVPAAGESGTSTVSTILHPTRNNITVGEAIAAIETYDTELLTTYASTLSTETFAEGSEIWRDRMIMALRNGSIIYS